MLGNSEPTGLDDFLKSFNLSIGKGMIIDRQAESWRETRDWSSHRSSRRLKHPIVEALGPNRAVLLPGAAPIEVAGAGRPGTADGCARRSDARARRNPEHEQFVVGGAAILEGRRTRSTRTTEQSGPLSVGIAVAERGADGPAWAAHRKDKPRLVLFSCPAMAENIFQESIEPTWTC